MYALTDRKARDLLDWMSDIKIPDEHFFQTLNHNPQIPAPGAFNGTFVLESTFITFCPRKCSKFFQLQLLDRFPIVYIQYDVIFMSLNSTTSNKLMMCYAGFTNVNLLLTSMTLIQCCLTRTWSFLMRCIRNRHSAALTPSCWVPKAVFMYWETENTILN